LKHDAFGRMHWRRRLVNGLTARVVGLGGAAVIVAIALIFVYLLWVVLPLFLPASVTPRLDAAAVNHRALLLDVNDNSEVGLEVTPEGIFKFIALADGTELSSPRATEEPVLAALELQPVHNAYVVQTASGLLFVDAQYPVSFDGDVRRIEPRIDFPFGESPLPVGDLRAFDVYRTDDEVAIAVLRGEREVVVTRYEEAEPGFPLEFGETFSHTLERRYARVLFGPRAQWLYFLSRRGEIEVLDISDPEQPARAFLGRVLPQNETLVAVEPMLGRYSLLVAGAGNRVTQWFLLRDDFGYRMARIRDFDIGARPKLVIPESARKGFAVVDEHDRLHLAYTTSERVTAVAETGVEGIDRAVISPRSDLALLEGNGRLALLDVDNHHPEVSWSALWTRVWYEGYPEPVLSWQSSSADNAFEPKYSLSPLAFGTLKAAFYAMIFAMPVAIMGAIYTAYFMAPSMRRWVKPGIEIMAALPTVILGFLAGLWLAPLVEAKLTGVLIALVVLPLGILAFSVLFAFAPRRLVRASQGWYGAITVPVLFVLIWGALSVGPVVEQTYFDGDVKAWLAGTFGVSYDQRNALIVGIAMGLAVIPTIFSIAEDAIYGVPRSLINGSLALGATWWQTLVRVVLLTASPGIFSAVMIGFGRAVGETMIVLMATGNTAVMDFSIFQGMRTFSANIAVELPESEVGSTHYRILFLAALVLFLITFVFNTIAELVRQRLRGRYGSL
jgi:phosphate transport system permease protein